MRVEFTVPLPETEAQPKENFDGFLQEALAFMSERPVFTAQELHEHLLSRFRIGDDPHEFWRCLTSIRIAVQAVCEANGTPAEWHQQEKRGYSDRLLSLDIAGPPLGEMFDSQLAQHVRAELAALFRGRNEIKEDEILFYLQAHQGFIDDAEEIAQLLINDGFLCRTNAGDYQLGSAARPVIKTPKARLELPPVEVDGVMVVGIPRSLKAANPTVRPAPVTPPSERQLSEVSPPTPDEPFTAEDMGRALVVLKRIFWHSVRQEGVPASELVAAMEDGILDERARRFIVVRLWRRGYLLRDVSNPQDSVVHLRPDLVRNRDAWPVTLSLILEQLALPHDPSAQQKAGSQ